MNEVDLQAGVLIVAVCRGDIQRRELNIGSVAHGQVDADKLAGGRRTCRQDGKKDDQGKAHTSEHDGWPPYQDLSSLRQASSRRSKSETIPYSDSAMAIKVKTTTYVSALS